MGALPSPAPPAAMATKPPTAAKPTKIQVPFNPALRQLVLTLPEQTGMRATCSLLSPCSRLSEAGSAIAGAGTHTAAITREATLGADKRILFISERIPGLGARGKFDHAADWN